MTVWFRGRLHLTAADIVTVANLLNPHPVSLASLPNPPNLDVPLSTRFKPGDSVGNTGFNVNNWPLDFPDALAEARLLSVLGQLDVKTSALFQSGQNIGNVANLLNPHPVSLASIPNPSNLDVALSTRALESGGNLAAIAAKDFATQTTLALIKAKTDNLDVALSLIKAKTDNLDLALSARTLTKHDNTIYYSTNSVSLAANGILLAAQASNKIRIHSIWGQGAANIEGNIQDGSGGTNILHFKLNDREGFLLPFTPSPAFWGQNAVINTALYITFITAGQSYWTMVYSLV